MVMESDFPIYLKTQQEMSDSYIFYQVFFKANQTQSISVSTAHGSCLEHELWNMITHSGSEEKVCLM